MKTFEITPEILTERLMLNAPNMDDTQTIANILNKDIYYENTLTLPRPYTTESAIFWVTLAENGLKNNHLIFAIREKDNPKIIGGIDLMINTKFNQAEIGYWMDENFFNKGYTTEALKAIINFGFSTLELKRIFATHFDSNPASGRVMEKAGMTKEGVLKCYTKKDGTYQDHVMYAIINTSV